MIGAVPPALGPVSSFTAVIAPGAMADASTEFNVAKAPNPRLVRAGPTACAPVPPWVTCTAWVKVPVGPGGPNGPGAPGDP